MKSNTKLFLFIFIISTLISCRKSKICDEIPEGQYDATFKDDGSNSVNTVLFLSLIDENTIVLNTSGDPNIGPFLIRNDCSIGGTIEGRSCLGEIKRKRGVYVLEGNYSYLSYNGGLGNPNPSFEEIKGKFEIKSN
jgi:hypothetical protein